MGAWWIGAMPTRNDATPRARPPDRPAPAATTSTPSSKSGVADDAKTVREPEAVVVDPQAEPPKVFRLHVLDRDTREPLRDAAAFGGNTPNEIDAPIATGDSPLLVPQCD